MKYILLFMLSFSLFSCETISPSREVTTLKVETAGSIATQTYVQNKFDYDTIPGKVLTFTSKKPFSVLRGNNFYSIIGQEKYQILENVAFQKISSDHSLSCISFSYNSIKQTSYKKNTIEVSVIVKLYKDFCKKSVTSYTSYFYKQPSAEEVITSAYSTMDAVFKKYNKSK